MVKKIILILIFTISFSTLFFGEETSPPNSLIVRLRFPDSGTPAMKTPGAILKPQEMSGQVFIDIQPHPLKAEKDRYIVEYFLDDKLIYETTGIDEQNPERVFFGYLFDTTKYENGRHKFIANFWDKDGPSAIGVREVVINNK